ncbi:tRNA1(Val) (adenine(37)-N6)-methyltransferase [Gorillibacterium sp. sgz5001074]|uniref:tRNA1(Val) (adenine(37)-N6)-methyltransferase n=1 Tax=Gorillibacterium sp. sgz5001074 TaxID=3446695 RepID=UPI003F66149C
MLRDHERADDLLRNDLKIIQSDEVFAFSMDAVLLARFCSVPARGRIMDLCTGNGVVPLLVSTRTRSELWGVEIQERLADMAARSVALNGLEERIHIHQGDLKDIHRTVGMGTYDLVTVNPPYMPVTAGEQNANLHLAAARHEIYCTLEDVIAACSRLVKYGGKVAMVHRPTRLVDIVTLMRKYKLEPKRLRFVHPRAEEEANMVLVEGIREGKPDLRLLPPLLVYGPDGHYTPELQSIYYGQADSLRPDEGA